MARVGFAQADLFAVPVPGPAPVETGPAPVEELRALLEQLRGAAALPWANLADAMAAEYRAMGLGRLAGSEGAALVSAILEQTERLFSEQERAV